MLKKLGLTVLMLLASSAAALAHPHVWVVVRSEVLFNGAGRITGIRHHWTFDDMYSAYLTTGLGKDGKDPTTADLQPAAQTNMDSLKEFDFFTYGKASGKKAPLAGPSDYFLTYDPSNQTVTLHYTISFATPQAAKDFVLQVYDPTYFVDLEIEKTDGLMLSGAPKGCSLNIFKPEPLTASETQSLSESVFSGQSPGDDFGIKLADRAIVACP